ncbi:hypothetical protein MMC13_001311 [Lambiella insularis]|nr:hypothetical protein [Lambiella insularis]
MANLHILIINPNSTKSMTDALQPLVEGLNYPNTAYHYFTAPSGPPSINNAADISASVTACLPHLEKLVDTEKYDGYLIACYSHHPLVSALRTRTAVPVLGIFEASVVTALQLLNPKTELREQFGIVSTGKVWEELLGTAVLEMLGTASSARNGRVAGVETTGLDATELHSAPQEEVKRRIKEAARKLVERGNVKVVLLGCAGMVGMETWVKEEVGEAVKVVDGLKAGIVALQGLIRAGF